jgi:hypothetical protein
VRDAEVILVAASNGARTYGSSRTDGTFAFGNLSTGTYTLKINPPKNLAGVTSPTPVTVQVTSGQTTDAGSIALRAAKKTITVTVAYPDGTKATGARVQATERGGQGFVATETANDAGQSN